jgi:hypothetical protein
MVIRHFLIAETKESTLSAMYIDSEFMGFILEDGPNKIKINGETRVDAGGPYHLKPVQAGKFFAKYKAKYSHRFAISVLGFPRHSAIMYHLLNEVAETRGCFGPGMAAGKYRTKPLFYVRESEVAYLKLYDKLDRVFDPIKVEFTEEVVLYIHRETPWQIFNGEKRLESF